MKLTRVSRQLDMQPERLRRGQIVEMEMSFRIYKAGERKIFIISPVWVALESDIGVFVSDTCFFALL